MQPILPKNKYLTQAQSKIQRKKAFLPKFILFVGFVLIITQVIPLLASYIGGLYLSAKSRESDYIPISSSFMDSLTSVKYVDPGSAFFEAVVGELASSVADTQYKTEMRISIPKSKINNIKLRPNVTGSNPKIYEAALKVGVAHLKGTTIPGDKGTSIIYGHSGVAGVFARNSPQLIFSRLDTVSIGDTMSIQRDGNELRYVVSGKKIIEPENLSFLDDKSTKERAVLMTCWPLGIGTKRLVIIADRI